jgi:hypothetical protein
MQTVPIIDVPSQTLNVTLSGQYTTINLWTRVGGMYMDVYVNNALIIAGIICQNLNQIVRDTYLGFSGDFLFFDTQGESDPSSPGLGTRYLLIYISPADIASAIA